MNTVCYLANPHTVEVDDEINGYFIPANSVVFDLSSALLRYLRDIAETQVGRFSVIQVYTQSLKGSFLRGSYLVGIRNRPWTLGG